jgi:dynein heavy chain 1
VHSKYTGADFDDDIRLVLRRAGCKNEQVCFIMDESNMLDTGFLERLNTLLANGEVPGLFEGDEFTSLMSQIKEGSQRQGLMLDTTEELYKWFTAQVGFAGWCFYGAFPEAAEEGSPRPSDHPQPPCGLHDEPVW